MRGALLLAAMVLPLPLPVPAMAQDHAQHQQAPTPTPTPTPAPTPAPSEAQANPLGSIRIAPPVRRPLNQAATPQVDHSTIDHGAMDHGAMTADVPEGPPPPRALEKPDHAAAAIWGEEAMAVARARNHEVHGGGTFATLLVERAEVRFHDGEEGYLWDAQGWYGDALDKLVLKTEGEGAFGGTIEEAEVQLLWGHAITPWFDLQAGLRLDIEPQVTPQLALGVQGLAPYNIHLDATAFLSDQGDLTARVEAEHDMRLTQRLILQPRVEVEFAAQDIPELGVGAGVPHLSAGLRLRYEVTREFAPYLGVEYETATGRTADRRRAAGEDAGGLVLLLGLRTFF
ncbi:copper resistance protein B [Erythrobacter arachoides]|uniref:Copper resistance protein B n=1 Tax=Aurantiacibacter arachoides TaxID=1850444 RepID=A0A845A6A7_9SPHN|nr:copper resistance protein B [Aurantiacibacter arachoides]MXO94457.1 copper resistance protein B [Aurantiacibacter arachoides]GGD63301.1 copper resistance protein B [Aurantiacibacter arachoides]